MLRKRTLACQPGSVASVTSEAYVQVPYHWYPNTVENLLNWVFLPICMANPVHYSCQTDAGWVFLVGWLAFLFGGFFVVVVFNIYGLNEQTGEFKHSLAKSPVRFCALLWISKFQRLFWKPPFTISLQKQAVESNTSYCSVLHFANCVTYLLFACTQS